VLRGNAELYSAVTNRSGIHPNVRISGRSGQGLLVEQVIGTFGIQVYQHVDAVPQAQVDTEVGRAGLVPGQIRVPLLIGCRARKVGVAGILRNAVQSEGSEVRDRRVPYRSVAQTQFSEGH